MPPVSIGVIHDVKQLDTGQHHACAVLASGRVDCWGSNSQGELGATTSRQPSMVRVEGIEDALYVAVGDGFSCARHASGKTSCWGARKRGVLGDGETSNYPQPTVVQGLTDAVDVTLAQRSACALTRKGEVFCWGGTDSASTNAPRSWFDAGPNAQLLQSAWSGPVCALSSNGTVRCRKELDSETREYAIGASQVVPFNDGINAARVGSKVMLWTGALKPTYVSKLDDVVDLAGDFEANRRSACAVRQSGKVTCFAYEYKDGEHLASHVTTIPGIGDGVSIMFVGHDYCVRRRTDDHVCFPFEYPRTRHKTGMPAFDPRTISIEPNERLRGAKAYADANDDCILYGDQTVACWGKNEAGGLGLGDYEPRDVPTKLPALSSVVAIDAYRGTACAVRSSGEVLCWGSNEGILAGQPITSYRTKPAFVLDPD